jgi:hypothetical protein
LFGETIALAMLGDLSRASAVAASLPAKIDASILRSIRTVLAALPVLGPVWLIGEYDEYWDFWNSWSGAIRHLGAPVNVAVLMIEVWSPLAAQMAINIGSLAAFFVLTPVALTERRSLPDVLLRTWRLMSGSRWKVVSLYLLYGVVVIVVVALPSAAVVIADRGHSVATGSTVANWIISAGSEAIAACWAVVTASTYLELLRLHEGPPHDQLADIFA